MEYKYMQLGIPVKCKRSPNEVHETLTRMGIPSWKDKKLTQTCHLIELDTGETLICHFKEAMLLEGSHAEFDNEDIPRRNRIIERLIEWNMIDIDPLDDNTVMLNLLDHVTVISYKDKKEWKLVSKYIPRRKIFL